MLLRDYVVHRLIGSPIERHARRARDVFEGGRRQRNPELIEIYREGSRIEDFLTMTLERETNCVDVGCHLGSVLDRFVRLAPEGRHLAFEPVPYKTRWLRRKYPHVEIHDEALGAVARRATFYLNGTATGYSGLRIHDSVGREVAELSVQVTTLDEAVGSDREVGFMKIDVEGGELDVLRGARRLLSRCAPTLLFECTRSGTMAHGHAPEDVFDHLVEQGYRIYLLKDALERGPALQRSDFERAVQYPFLAFNFVARNDR